jgi:hypothetical protein
VIAHRKALHILAYLFHDPRRLMPDHNWHWFGALSGDRNKIGMAQTYGLNLN